MNVVSFPLLLTVPFAALSVVASNRSASQAALSGAAICTSIANKFFSIFKMHCDDTMRDLDRNILHLTLHH